MKLKKGKVRTAYDRNEIVTRLWRQQFSREVLSNAILAGLECDSDAVRWIVAKKKRVAWVTRVSRSSWPELESHEIRPRFSPLIPVISASSENNHVASFDVIDHPNQPLSTAPSLQAFYSTILRRKHNYLGAFSQIRSHDTVFAYLQRLPRMLVRYD